jgi:hypothetical protein
MPIYFSFTLLSLPLLLMSYQLGGMIDRRRSTSLFASTFRSLIDDPIVTACDRCARCSFPYREEEKVSSLSFLTYSFPTMCSKFSFERLPSPLKANSQKVALKLLAISRKIRNLSKVLSEEEITNLTGLTVENMNNILSKSEQVEKKLLEGTSTLT